MTDSMDAQAYKATQTESQFQAAVLKLATRLGWWGYHTRNSKGSGKGFPDLFLVHPDQARAVMAELKVGRNQLSPEQTDWQLALLEVEMAIGYPGRFSSWVWTPEDWDEIEMVLSPAYATMKHL
jgi:hypothetical protein